MPSSVLVNISSADIAMLLKPAWWSVSALKDCLRKRSAVGLLAAISAATLCACAVGPNYQRPVTPVSPQFANVGQPGFSGSEVEARFWTLFKDPKLDQLVDELPLATAGGEQRHVGGEFASQGPGFLGAGEDELGDEVQPGRSMCLAPWQTG